MGRVADYFSAPQAPFRPTPQIQNVRLVQNLGVLNNEGILNDQGRKKVMPQTVVQNIPRVVNGNLCQNGPEAVLVNMNQDGYLVARNVQQNNFGGKNNIGNMVEQIPTQNGINVGMHVTHFNFALSEYVLQAELPRG